MAEETEEEAKEMQENRDSALKSINAKGKMWDYALPKLATFERFGQLSELAKGKYLEAISQAPDQDTYQKVFFPQLASENGAVTSPYIQNASAQILQESFSRILVQDALDYLGLKGNLKGDYSGKYVSQLSEEDQGKIIGSCMTYTTNNKVQDLLGTANQSVASGLEEMLIESEEEQTA